MGLKQKQDKERNWALITGCIIVLMIIFLGLLQPYFEMQAFNKFRKKGQPEATYIDALTSELRITTTER